MTKKIVGIIVVLILILSCEGLSGGETPPNILTPTNHNAQLNGATGNIDISWEKVDGADSYTVQVFVSDDSGWNDFASGITSESVSYNIVENLTRNETYSRAFRLKAVFGEEFSPWSTEENVIFEGELTFDESHDDFTLLDNGDYHFEALIKNTGDIKIDKISMRWSVSNSDYSETENNSIVYDIDLKPGEQKTISYDGSIDFTFSYFSTYCNTFTVE